MLMKDVSLYRDGGEGVLMGCKNWNAKGEDGLKQYGRMGKKTATIFVI